MQGCGRMMGWAIFVLCGLASCHKARPQALPDLAQDTLIQHIVGRDVPQAARSRLSVKLHSKKLGIAAPPLGGGLVVQQPDRAYLAIFPPIGAAVLTAASDGHTLRLLNAHDKQYVEEPKIQEAISQLSRGALSLSDIIDMLLGKLPAPSKEVSTKRDRVGWRLTWSPVDAYRVRAWVDAAHGTPIRIEVLHGMNPQPVVEATYEPFEPIELGPDGATVWMPSKLHIWVPSVELSVDLRYKKWVPLAVVPPVFAPKRPEGWAQRTLADFGKNVSKTTSQLGEDDPQASTSSAP